MALDFEEMRAQASAWAYSNVGCKVVLVGAAARYEGPPVATFRMVDEDGEETGEVDVKDAGTFLGRQMMFVMDSNGEVICEAFGDMLARLLYM